MISLKTTDVDNAKELCDSFDLSDLKCVIQLSL